MSTIPETQKALVIPKPGASYELTTRPVPRPGPGDVLIKLEAVALNPAEWKCLKLDLTGMAKAIGLSPAYPAMMGQDAAGTVVEVGSGVEAIGIGDRVIFQGWFEHDRCAHQEYTLASADLVAKIPPSMSFLEAASIPLGLATAALGFVLPYSVTTGGLGLKGFWEDGAAGHYKGQAILIYGGSSSVGQFAIQIARHLGFSTIVTTSSAQHTAFLRTLGATHVVDRHADRDTLLQPLAPPAAAAAAPQAGFPYIYDAVHAPVSHADAALLAPGGTLVTVSEVDPELRLALALARAEGRRVAFVWGVVHMRKDVGRALYARLPALLEDGVIKPNRVEKVPGGLEGVVDGLKRMEAGQVSGHKLVVVPYETPGAV